VALYSLLSAGMRGLHCKTSIPVQSSDRYMKGAESYGSWWLQLLNLISGCRSA